eukprot:1611063-Amphidinium_carterae.1
MPSQRCNTFVKSNASGMQPKACCARQHEVGKLLSCAFCSRMRQRQSGAKRMKHRSTFFLRVKLLEHETGSTTDNQTFGHALIMSPLISALCTFWSVT